MNFVFASGKTEPIFLEVAERRFMLTPVPQPISTAPKDGTDILGWLGHDWTCVQFVYGEWMLSYYGTYCDDRRCDPPPTHWLPQPGAPT